MMMRIKAKLLVGLGHYFDYAVHGPCLCSLTYCILVLLHFCLLMEYLLFCCINPMIVGGVMGYVKGGSQKSLVAGGTSALVLYHVYTQLPERPVYASSLGLGWLPTSNSNRGLRVRSSSFSFLLWYWAISVWNVQAPLWLSWQWWVLVSRDQASCFLQVLCLLCP